jgi:uncharacterized membrane protein
VLVVAVGGWLAAAPFHLSFHPPFQGVDRVRAWTEPALLVLWGGILLVPVVAAAWALVLRSLGDDRRSRAVGATLAAAVLVLAAQTEKPTLILLAALLVVLVAAVVTGQNGRHRPGLALAALGVFLLLVPEVLYVVDSYGEQLHRMNTVFKCYIQAWVFLAVALPTLLGLGFKNRRSRVAAIAFLTVMSLPHLAGMAVQPLIGNAVGLDGLGWMDAGDRAVVRYLRSQPHGSVIVEAVGGAYTEYARISSASGVPSILGWANHELVWRGQGVSATTEGRRRLVERVYRSENPGAVRAAVGEAGADFVVIGALERRDFDPAHLDAVRAAGVVVLDESGGEVVAFERAGED